MVNINEILFRASQISDLCGAKGLGATGEKRALYNYVEHKYGRVKEFTAKQTSKGTKTEESSIEWLSELDGVKYVKNEVRLNNEYFTGECDIHYAEIEDVKDIKNSWDIFTFTDSLQAHRKENEWQLRVYMDLYKCKTSELVYTLNDAPIEMVLDALFWESKKHPDIVTPEWREVEIVRNMVFTQKLFDEICYSRQWGGDELTDKMISLFIPIPPEERIVRYKFEADPDKLKFMQERVILARKYLTEKFK